MDEQLLQLNDDLEAAVNEVKTLAAKSDATPEQLDAAKAKMNAVKTRIEAYKAASDVDDWQNKWPAGTYGNAGYGSGGNGSSGSKSAKSTPLPQPGARLTGFKSAGESVFEGAKALYQNGEGLLSDAQIKTITAPEYNGAFKSYLRNKGDVRLMRLDEVKTLEEGRDEDGGFLVPAEMIARIIERKPTPTRVAGMVTTYNTSRDVLALPRQTGGDDIYTTGIRVNWTGEGGNPGPVNGPKFGTQRIPVYTAMLELGLTNDLLEDAVFPIQSYVADKFRETVDILKDDMAIRGSGVGQPTGMLSYIGAPNGIGFIKSGDASSLTSDSLMKLAYAIPEQYMDNTRWLFNRTNTEAAIALLKDTTNRYLFAKGTADDSIATARPDRLLGFELIRSALMPNVEANKSPILFGDFSAYCLVLRAGFTIRVLTEIEARSNQTILLGRLRMGGGLLEPWRLRALKVAA